MARQWTPPTEEDVRQAVKTAITDLEVVEKEIASEASQGTYSRLLRAEFWGIRAATRKRLAEVEFLYGGDWRPPLRAALRDYEHGLQQGVQVDHWVLGQYVVLKYLLDESAGDAPGHDQIDFWWHEAYRSVTGALQSHTPEAKMWAYGSRVDLEMIAQAIPSPFSTTGRGRELDTQPSHVVETLRRMVEVMGGADQCPAVWPTYRQFWRWRFWWKNPGWDAAAVLGYDYLLSLVGPRLRLDDAPRS